jgi:hypothetical protein
MRTKTPSEGTESVQESGSRTGMLVASRGDGDETLKKNGASEGIRTLDTHVGNVMLYQAELRSLPFQARLN